MGITWGCMCSANNVARKIGRPLSGGQQRALNQLQRQGTGTSGACFGVTNKTDEQALPCREEGMRYDSVTAFTAGSDAAGFVSVAPRADAPPASRVGSLFSAGGNATAAASSPLSGQALATAKADAPAVPLKNKYEARKQLQHVRTVVKNMSLDCGYPRLDGETSFTIAEVVGLRHLLVANKDQDSKLIIKYMLAHIIQGINGGDDVEVATYLRKQVNAVSPDVVAKCKAERETFDVAFDNPTKLKHRFTDDTTGTGKAKLEKFVAAILAVIDAEIDKITT